MISPKKDKRNLRYYLPLHKLKQILDFKYKFKVQHLYPELIQAR